jgi:hypothetical protein
MAVELETVRKLDNISQQVESKGFIGTDELPFQKFLNIGNHRLIESTNHPIFKVVMDVGLYQDTGEHLLSVAYNRRTRAWDLSITMVTYQPVFESDTILTQQITFNEQGRAISIVDSYPRSNTQEEFSQERNRLIDLGMTVRDLHDFKLIDVAATINHFLNLAENDHTSLSQTSQYILIRYKLIR